jgi:hypothetical protein
VVLLSSLETVMPGHSPEGGKLGVCEEIIDLFREKAPPYCGAEPTRQAKERRRQGRARRVLMTGPPWMEASLEGPIPGCVRLQICGLFARFCRDLQSYVIDIVDVAMSPVQFETRHPPQ